MEELRELAELAISYRAAILIYLAVINLVAFVLYGIDKLKAKRKSWRIPESRLIAAAVLGGSLGALAGMLVFRHKTLHAKFVVTVPLLLAAHISMITAVILYSQMQ